jgi:hypothetical protein
MCRLQPCSSWHRTQRSRQSLQAGVSSHFPEPASRGTAPSALKPEDLVRNVCEVSGHCSPYLQIHVATVLSKEGP